MQANTLSLILKAVHFYLVIQPINKTLDKKLAHCKVFWLYNQY